MRPKSTNRDLPPRMIRVRKTLKSGKEWVSYYYNGRTPDGQCTKLPLGSDLNEAKRQWAQFECVAIPADTSLMRFIFDRYEKEIVPSKSPRTQKDNLHIINMLRKVFDTAPIDAITPQIVAQYRDKRGQDAPVRANREITLLSHVFNMAREWGFTARENPVKGVRKNKETPRDYYADDAVWNAVYAVACDELKGANLGGQFFIRCRLCCLRCVVSGLLEPQAQRAIVQRYALPCSYDIQAGNLS